MTRLALSALSAAFAALPWGALRAVGRVVGWAFGSLLRIRRSAVERAMARARVERPREVAAQMYAGLGAGLCELLWLAGASPARRDRAVARAVRFDPALEAAIDEALDEGPVVFAASHTGNWELVAYAAARLLRSRGRSLAVVVKPISARAVDRFCTRLREGLGLVLVRPRGALAAAARVLDEGGAVAMPIDQVPDRARHADQVPFLGALAHADRAPFALARRSRATVLVVAARRDGSGQRVQLLGRLSLSRRRASSPSDATRVATSALDAFVRQAPESWLWLHRRWRAPLVASGEPS